eukprot:2431031-Rhodomonas_salina.1
MLPPKKERKISDFKVNKLERLENRKCPPAIKEKQRGQQTHQLRGGAPGPGMYCSHAGGAQPGPHSAQISTSGSRSVPHSAQISTRAQISTTGS